MVEVKENTDLDIQQEGSLDILNKENSDIPGLNKPENQSLNTHLPAREYSKNGVITMTAASGSQSITKLPFTPTRIIIVATPNAGSARDFSTGWANFNEEGFSIENGFSNSTSRVYQVRDVADKATGRITSWNIDGVTFTKNSFDIAATLQWTCFK